MKLLSSQSIRRLLVIPPVIVGVVVLIVLARGRKGPEKQTPAEVVRTLRVIEVPQVAVAPRVIGYGTAQPGDVWNAVVEVKGRVIQAHAELKAGAMFRQGDEVLRIDPAEYELQIAQLQADIAQVESQQAELSAQEKNFQASLKIEKASLALAERDLARLRSLTATSTVTESEVEKKEREVLAQQQSVQGLQSSLNVLPAQRDSLIATIAAKQAALARAKLDLSHTIISAPFDCRLSDVSIEQGQFLSAGQALFEAYGVGVTEVEAQLPLDQTRKLLDSSRGPVNINSDAMALMRSIFDVEVVVRMRTGDLEVEWLGRFDRVREQLDPQTRTVRVVVAVDKPYEGVIPGERPPLAPGMFCEVELRGKSRPDQVVIPRSSLHDGQVFVVSEQRLQRRPVEIAMAQEEFYVVQSGLQPGEMVVVSDPTPAIDGMLVEAMLDTESAKRLVDDASGTNLD